MPAHIIRASPSGDSAVIPTAFTISDAPYKDSGSISKSEVVSGVVVNAGETVRVVVVLLITRRLCATPVPPVISTISPENSFGIHVSPESPKVVEDAVVASVTFIVLFPTNGRESLYKRRAGAESKFETVVAPLLKVKSSIEPSQKFVPVPQFAAAEQLAPILVT